MRKDTEPKKKKRDPEVAARKTKRRKEKLKNDLVGFNPDKALAHAPPGEREYIQEYVWMFHRISRLIRKTEKRALKSGQSRDIYALNVLLSQQREIIADIRTLSDLSQQVDQIKAQLLQPLVRDLGSNYVDTYYQLRTLVTNIAKPKDSDFALKQLDVLMEEMGKYLQIRYRECVETLGNILLGAPEETKTRSKTKKKKTD